MLFQNFNNFDFMFDRTAQNIKVKPYHSEQQTIDDTGDVVSKFGDTITVKAEIINTQNPNATYSNLMGGIYSSINLYAVTKATTDTFDKYTRFILSDGKEFEVAGNANDILGGLTVYSLESKGFKDAQKSE